MSALWDVVKYAPLFWVFVVALVLALPFIVEEQRENWRACRMRRVWKRRDQWWADVHTSGVWPPDWSTFPKSPYEGSDNG